MNKEKRRRLGKKSNQFIKTVLKFKNLKTNNNKIKEGIKVKLDVNKIKSHPDYCKMNPKYKQWVEEHYKETFTVEYDKGHKINPKIICFKEDATEPKWLFWTGDLTVID